MIHGRDDGYWPMHSTLARLLSRLSLSESTRFRGAKDFQTGDHAPPKTRFGPDWRAWLALMWALGWGWAYVIMVFHARAPQVSAWLRVARH
jgi:hypothetical protein